MHISSRRRPIRLSSNISRDEGFELAQKYLTVFIAELSTSAALSEQLGALYENNTITPEQDQLSGAVANMTWRTLMQMAEQTALLNSRMRQVLNLHKA